jgi:hypothetical protein
MLDVIRGIPAIYTLYAGYDEVAHHSGPYTHDADLTLRQFDKQVARIKQVIDTKATRPYELLLLSDHGQSYGATFKQRYGISILEFIEQQLPQGTSIAGTGGGDDGTIGVSAMMNELANMQEQKQAGRVGRAVINQTQRAMQRGLAQQPSMQEVKPAKVTFSYGGNGGLVYFDLFPRKITLNELNAAYPGMVDKVVQHEGIGFVIAYEDDYTPVAFGKGGARNLVSGDVVGEDPLLPYGDVELRTWQLCRMAEFENSGDLILNSTLYPDGSVAALEELIGNHGGLGGEQTEAYLFHPGDMIVPETRNSYEFKALLDSRRGLPGYPAKPVIQKETPVDPWAFSTLLKGLGQVGKWLGHAARTLILDIENYREIARDAYMLAPALLIVTLMTILRMVNQPNDFNWLMVIGFLAAWVVALILMHISARVLRGKAEFHQTLRVAGFAQTANIFLLLGFLPVIGPLARILASVLTLVGVWIGVATAHELKGWRSIVLPLIYIVVFGISIMFIMAVMRGVDFALSSLLADIGWVPKP